MQTVSRLIQTFSPSHYELSLTFDRPNRTFEGTVTINGTSLENSQEIRLHSKDLEIHSVTIDGKRATYRAHDFDELALKHPDLGAGEHLIVIGFSGIITDLMHGLYPCYFEHDGVKKELLATQFESHYAREVFPCVDEPEAKATFSVTLTTEPNVTVLGNMPIKQQTVEDDKLVTSFETTPKMSSYLLAWVIGELHKKSAMAKGGVEVNLWATPAQPLEMLDFGLDIAARTIDFFDEYFGTPYPLKKSDHVALPDFASGAMENWGLITYREIALLADPKKSSLSNKRTAALVIAHELSHQWFGNLVTMKWWNDLWLNESFANMMGYLAVDTLEPDWNIWLDHASSDVLHSLRRDSLEGVQSIQVAVHHPDEISALFDPSIVYAKGGRLLRMLQTYIGDGAFRDGLKLYFKKYAYQNTAADDLWACFSETSDQDVTSFMNTWIGQPGFPVLHVSREGKEVALRQEQFFIGAHEPSNALWPIPLNSTCSEMPKLLSEELTTVTRHHTTPLRLNTGGTSIFITHYDPELFNQILANLSELPDIDRLQLLHEQTLLAQAGVISSADLIPLLDHYRSESTEAVWEIMAVAISELKKFVETDPVAEKSLRRFVGQLAETQFQRLGWERQDNEPETDTKLRSLIISLMIYSERADAIKEAHRLYEKYEIEALDPELRTSIMACVVRESTDHTVTDQLLELYRTTSLSELQEDIAAALTSTRDVAVIHQLIGHFQDSDVIRPQDFIRWFIWLLRNRYGRELTWTWGQQHWDWIRQTFHGMYYDSFPRYIAGSLITPEQLQEYRKFFTPLRTERALKRNIDLGLAELTGKVELIARDGEAVRRALVDL